MGVSTPRHPPYTCRGYSAVTCLKGLQPHQYAEKIATPLASCSITPVPVSSASKEPSTDSAPQPGLGAGQNFHGRGHRNFHPCEKFNEVIFWSVLSDANVTWVKTPA
jgi:hypothetical protein